MSTYFMDDLPRVTGTRPAGWVPAQTSQYDRGLDLMSGNLPSYIAFTPAVVKPLLDAGLETLKTTKRPWETMSGFEQNIVYRALNDPSPALRRMALDYLTEKAHILDEELPYGYQEWEAAHGSPNRQWTPKQRADYSTRLAALASLMPDDPNVQKAIADFYQGGTSYQAPSDWSARVGPLTTLLAYHGPGGFQELGLPLPKAPTPNAMTQPEVRRAYEDYTAMLTQYDTTGRHLIDPRTGKTRLSPEAYVTGGIDQYLPALHENVATPEQQKAAEESAWITSGEATTGYLTDKDAATAVKGALYEDEAELGDETEGPLNLGLSPDAVDVLVTLRDRYGFAGPKAAKDYLIVAGQDGVGRLREDILDAYAGDESDAVRREMKKESARVIYREVIGLLDRWIRAGKGDQWPSEVTKVGRRES